MSPLELLFETLRFFDLGKNYLDGENHWDLWLKRQISKKNEETKQKGFLGKKKHKKKKRFDDTKESVLIKPTWFDIEPFHKALTKFIGCDLKNREKVCKIFRENKDHLMQLFVKDNFELKENRCVDFQEIFMFMTKQLGIKLEEDFIEIIPNMLICFGALDFNIEKIQIVEKKARNKNPGKFTEKLVKKISFKELYKSLGLIKEFDYLLQNRDSFLETIYLQFDQKMDLEIKTILGKHNQASLKDFDAELLSDELFEVPEELQNIISINMFFIDDGYKQNSIEFISYVFQYFKNRDYIIISLPHKSLEIDLLDSFNFVPLKKNSNFSHCLYFYHRLNLLTPLIKVKQIKRNRFMGTQDLQLDIKPEIKDKIFKIGIQLNKKFHRLGHAVLRKKINLQDLKEQYDTLDQLDVNSYKRNEVIEIKSFKLNKIFEKNISFILRSILT